MRAAGLALHHAARGHVPALDGLRGLAILVTFPLHFMLAVAPQSAAADPAAYAINYVREAGWIGVDLFFVLSGFLITGILYDAKPGEPRGARGAKHYFAAFYMRRALRIFPLYYLFLIAVFVVLPALGRPHYVENLHVPPRDQLWAWLYLVNAQIVAWYPRGVAWSTGTFWSLAVEEQFYLLWPSVVLLCASRFGLVRICAAMILGAIAFRTGDALFWTHGLAAYHLPFGRMDAFAVGALAALAVRAPGGPARVGRLAGRALAAAAVAFAVLYATTDGLQRRYVGLQMVGYTVVAVFFGALLCYVVSRGESRLAGLFRHPALRFFGRYSYAMYLVHLPLAQMIAVLLFNRYGPAGNLFAPGAPRGMLFGSHAPMIVLYMLVSTAATAAVALLSWHLVEKRVLALKDRFPYAR